MPGKLTGPVARPRRPSRPMPTAVDKLRFTDEDITRLCNAAGAAPVFTGSPAEFASALERAFKVAASFGQLDEGWASASEVIDYYSRVESHAEQLLFALGYSPHDLNSLPNPHVPFDTGSLLWLLPERHDGEPEKAGWQQAVPIAAPTANRDRIASVLQWRQEQDRKSGRLRTNDEYEALGNAIAVRDMLELAPRAIAVLHALAKGRREAMAARETHSLLRPRTGRGDRPDAIARRLFDALLQIYVAMFGNPPQTRRTGAWEEKDGPATKWAMQLLRLANQRIRSAAGDRIDPVTQRVLALTEQSVDSVALAIENAWRRQSKPENGGKPPTYSDSVE